MRFELFASLFYMLIAVVSIISGIFSYNFAPKEINSTVFQSNYINVTKKQLENNEIDLTSENVSNPLVEVEENARNDSLRESSVSIPPETKSSEKEAINLTEDRSQESKAIDAENYTYKVPGVQVVKIDNYTYKIIGGIKVETSRSGWYISCAGNRCVGSYVCDKPNSNETCLCTDMEYREYDESGNYKVAERGVQYFRCVPKGFNPFRDYIPSSDFQQVIITDKGEIIGKNMTLINSGTHVGIAPTPKPSEPGNMIIINSETHVGVGSK